MIEKPYSFFEVVVVYDKEAKGKNMEVCSCIDNELENLGEPLFRLVCHCTTCRRYTRSDFFDESTFLLKDCGKLSFDKVEFNSYQKGFSPMKRGKCKECGKISYSTIRVWPFPRFVMLPSVSVNKASMKMPFAHLYYKSRVVDTDDSTTKINGHILSQLLIQLNIIKGLLARKFKQQRQA